MNERLVKFGSEVKKLRVQKGLSQEALAKMSGFKSRQAIQVIEKGKSDISIERLKDLSKALGVAPSYFLDSVLAEERKAEYVASITKDLSEQGIEMLKLYVESLKQIPGMTVPGIDQESEG